MVQKELNHRTTEGKYQEDEWQNIQTWITLMKISCNNDLHIYVKWFSYQTIHCIQKMENDTFINDHHFLDCPRYSLGKGLFRRQMIFERAATFSLIPFFSSLVRWQWIKPNAILFKRLIFPVIIQKLKCTRFMHLIRLLDNFLGNLWFPNILISKWFLCSHFTPFPLKWRVFGHLLIIFVSIYWRIYKDKVISCICLFDQLIKMTLIIL